MGCASWTLASNRTCAPSALERGKGTDTAEGAQKALPCAGSAVEQLVSLGAASLQQGDRGPPGGVVQDRASA